MTIRTMLIPLAGSEDMRPVMEIGLTLGRDVGAHVDVLRLHEEVVGFCNYWLVHDEVHLLNIAIAPARRRQGLARRLMDELLDFARRHECTTVILEVRKSNRAAIELYHSYGFEAVGLRPRYYVEDREDALVMSLSLGKEPSLVPAADADAD